MFAGGGAAGDDGGSVDTIRNCALSLGYIADGDLICCPYAWFRFLLHCLKKKRQ